MFDCNYCERQYPPDEEYTEGFCSATCEASDRAETVLNIIDHDHRFCSNCYRQIRDVYPPTRAHDSKHITAHDDWGPFDDPYAFMDEIPDFAIGRAFPRPHCVDSPNAEVFRTTDGPAWGFSPHPELWKKRAVCSCGAMHHRTVMPDVRAQLLKGIYADQLSQAVRHLLSEDEHDKTHDPTVLKRELQNSYLRLNEEWQRKQVIRCLGEAIVSAPW